MALPNYGLLVGPMLALLELAPIDWGEVMNDKHRRLFRTAKAFRAMDPITHLVIWLTEHPTKAAEPSSARHAPQWVQEFDPVVLDPLLPPAPMCFDARDRWIDYVAACRKDHSIVRGAGGGLNLNPAWSWCEDCLPEFRAPMVRARRCHPPAVETSRRISSAAVKTARP